MRMACCARWRFAGSDVGSNAGCGERTNSFMLELCTDWVAPLSGAPHLSWGSTGVQKMTLTRFVTKNALRNKRRSILTVLSVGVSLLLLTFMITMWQGFYIDKGSAETTRRLVTRHRVSLTFTLPGFYRE